MSIHGEIISRSLQQRLAAFAELYDRHERVVYRYAARRLGVSQADDITSETFLVAFTRREGFVGEDARPWLLGIATRLMQRYARLEARAWKGMLASDLARVDVDQFEAADARLDAKSVARRLGRALALLPAGDRDALLLHTFGDLDYEGISQALSIPLGDCPFPTEPSTPQTAHRDRPGHGSRQGRTPWTRFRCAAPLSE